MKKKKMFSFLMLVLVLSTSFVYANICSPIIFNIPVSLNSIGNINMMSGIAFGNISIVPQNKTFLNVVGPSDGAYINVTLLNDSDLYDLKIIEGDKTIPFDNSYILNYNQTYKIEIGDYMGNYSLKFEPKKIGVVNDVIKIDFYGLNYTINDSILFNISAVIKGNISVSSKLSFGDMYLGFNLQPEKTLFIINENSAGANITITLLDASNDTEEFYFVRNGYPEPLSNNKSYSYILGNEIGNQTLKVILNEVNVINGMIKLEIDGEELYYDKF